MKGTPLSSGAWERPRKPREVAGGVRQGGHATTLLSRESSISNYQLTCKGSQMQPFEQPSQLSDANLRSSKRARLCPGGSYNPAHPESSNDSKHKLQGTLNVLLPPFDDATDEDSPSLQLVREEKYDDISKECASLHARTLHFTAFLSKLQSSLSTFNSEQDLIPGPHSDKSIIHKEMKSSCSKSEDLPFLKEQERINNVIVLADSDDEKKECTTFLGDNCLEFQKPKRPKCDIDLYYEPKEHKYYFVHAAAEAVQVRSVDTEIASKRNQQLDIPNHNIDMPNTSEACSSWKLLDLEHRKNEFEGKHGILDSVNIATEKSHASAGRECDVTLVPSPSIESNLSRDYESSEKDGLDDLWKEMSLAAEYSKPLHTDYLSVCFPMADGIEDAIEDLQSEECEHSFVLRDDLGLVCRICGIIQKSIENIFDYSWPKGYRALKTYHSECQTPKCGDEIVPKSGGKEFQDESLLAGMSIDPRHKNLMKRHQLHGFNFLTKNLLADDPGGCVLAHAPGSGKTFMVISFIQSFLAKCPSARTLIVLPKGILSTWKSEFHKWQLEDIPLCDFYSTKADKRQKQLEILRMWEENRSILLLGYQQFTNIVCSMGKDDKVTAQCREKLLKVPDLLVIDEGHNPRNEETDMLNSLSSVRTPRKVVLSGTIYQNHVKEVFNILNLVRPGFLKSENSRAMVRRILSRVQVLDGRRHFRLDFSRNFYELVEETLQNDSDFRGKAAIIQDLRQMTHDYLHYYKGDFLEELPGIVDLTVHLKLTAKQKAMIKKLGKLDRLKSLSVCSAIYLHPQLKKVTDLDAGEDCSHVNEKAICNAVDKLAVNDGVKAKIFLSILSMADTSGEKLLVFSQYLTPLKFLEKLLARLKGWRLGKETFMIHGKSNYQQRERSMEQFNNSPNAKVMFGSIKACGEGISLVGASRIILLDVHWNPSVSRQAIGRAYRPGQKNKVYVYRLIAADSPEEENHRTSFRKEVTSKMWFEWNEYDSNQDFSLKAVDVHDCGDTFMENPTLLKDLKCLYRRYT